MFDNSIETSPLPSPDEQDSIDITRLKLQELRNSVASYRVKSGDTLSSIAKKLSKERGIGISVKTLESLNSNVDPRKLRIGQQLNIPQSQAQPAAPREETKTVKRAEAKEQNESPPNVFVARVIFSEAGAEVDDKDRELIANVIKNRIGMKGMLRGAPPLPENREPTIADQMEQVVRTPHAFSCIGDPNNSNWERSAHPELMKGREKEAWEHALRLSTGDFAIRNTSVIFYHDRYHWVTPRNKTPGTKKERSQRIREEIMKPKSWNDVIEVTGVSERFKFYKKESRV